MSYSNRIHAVRNAPLLSLGAAKEVTRQRKCLHFQRATMFIFQNNSSPVTRIGSKVHLVVAIFLASVSSGVSWP